MKTSFFALTFQQGSSNGDSDKPLYRLFADGVVFYTYGDQFNNPELLDQLKKGDKIYVGAHPLKDGSYWLHWLYSREKGGLDLKIRALRKLPGLFKLLFSFPLFALGIYLFSIPWLVNDYPVSLMLVETVVLFAASIFFCLGIHRLLICFNPRWRKLRKGLCAVEQGDVAFCQTQTVAAMTTSLAKKSTDNEDDSEQQLLIVKGVASNVRPYKSKGSVNSRYHIPRMRATFECQRRYYEFYFVRTVRHEMRNPLFFYDHPFFLAENDPIELMINPEDNDTIGMFNEKDASIYLKSGSVLGTHHELFVIYKLMAAIGLCLPVFMSILMSYDWWKEGISLGKWEWRQLIEFFGEISLLSIGICSSFLLFIELIRCAVAALSGKLDVINRTKLRLIQLRKQYTQNIVINEVA